MSSGVNPTRIGEELLARLAVSADAYVQKFDLVRDQALLIEVDAPTYRAASFLDDRILRPKTKGGWVGLGRVVEAARGAQNLCPLHFIFHSGHVGSTLVSRLLDETSALQPVREPLPLRLLAEVHDALGEPDSLLNPNGFDELLDAFLRLWARGYAGMSQAVVKATSSAARLAAVILARRRETRAICLNLRAEPYIATLLAGENSPIDLRGHGPERIRRLGRLGIPSPAPLHQMSLGEQAAMSWLAETASQKAALDECNEQTIAVDFDRVLDDVPSEMARIVGHFGIACEAKVIAGLAHSPVLTRYAKATEHPYSPELRAQILAQSRVHNSAEIRRGLAWLDGIARSNAGAAAVIQASK